MAASVLAFSSTQSILLAFKIKLKPVMTINQDSTHCNVPNWKSFKRKFFM